MRSASKQLVFIHLSAASIMLRGDPQLQKGGLRFTGTPGVCLAAAATQQGLGHKNNFVYL